MSRVFITGSTDGLGLLAARALISEGHQVILHARSRERAAAVADLAPRADGQAGRNDRGDPVPVIREATLFRIAQMPSTYKQNFDMNPIVSNPDRCVRQCTVPQD